jgi:hypothetical protein
MSYAVVFLVLGKHIISAKENIILDSKEKKSVIESYVCYT